MGQAAVAVWEVDVSMKWMWRSSKAHLLLEKLQERVTAGLVKGYGGRRPLVLESEVSYEAPVVCC